MSDGEAEPNANLAEPSTASRRDLEKTMGKDVAAEISMILFQHCARNTTSSEYLNPSEVLGWKPSERSSTQPYRKTQLHSSTYFRCFDNILSGNNSPLTGNEACVILSGGTEEAAAAAVALKFKHVPGPHCEFRLLVNLCVCCSCSTCSTEVNYVQSSFVCVFVLRSRDRC